MKSKQPNLFFFPGLDMEEKRYWGRESPPITSWCAYGEVRHSMGGLLLRKGVPGRSCTVISHHILTNCRG